MYKVYETYYNMRMDPESRYYDKLELVYQNYERSLDLDIALTLVPLTDAERIRLSEDPDLRARINILDAKVKEDLLTDLRTLSKEATNDGVRLTALKELGKTLYPKRFKDNVVLPSEQPRAIRYELVEPNLD